MDTLRAFALSSLFLMVIGCSHGRISRLEKQKAELNKDRATHDLDLQSKCSRDARAWFNENWSRDKETILLDFSNHYNKTSNKCFVSVEYHYHTIACEVAGQKCTSLDEYNKLIQPYLSN